MTKTTEPIDMLIGVWTLRPIEPLDHETMTEGSHLEIYLHVGMLGQLPVVDIISRIR